MESGRARKTCPNPAKQIVNESSTCPLKKGLPRPGAQVPPIFNRTGQTARNRQAFFQNRQMAPTHIPPCAQIPSRRAGANSLVAEG